VSIAERRSTSLLEVSSNFRAVYFCTHKALQHATPIGICAVREQKMKTLEEQVREIADREEIKELTAKYAH
jgi:hypothetical protein